MSMKNNVLLTLVGVSLLLPSRGLAAELEKYRFLKVATQEQKAVVKTPDGKLQLVGVGEVIAEAKVVEIAEGRVVLEERGEQGTETVIVRLDGRHQRIERLHNRGEKAPMMVMPGNLPPGAPDPGKN
jgi:hypothetical protein